MIQRSQSSTATHTSAEDPILEIPISEDPLNKFRQQIIINVVNRSPKIKPLETKPFDTYLRISTEISTQNMTNDLIDFIKKHVNPNRKNISYYSDNSENF